MKQQLFQKRRVIMKWRVILDRGLDFEDKAWEHEKRSDAMRRACALAHLHHCDYTEFSGSRTMIVHAGKWYEKRGDR